MMNLLMNRTVLHMDLDCFFVSVSRLINPKLEKMPVIVGGGERGVVAACSYETRKFGVHSAMPIRQAKRLCPEAIIIRGDYDEYSKRSDEITQIIKEDVPVYERSSIDEFYMDLTGMDRFFGCYKHALELREKIIRETGLPISFGMSANKTVSKVATDEAKPNNHKQVPHGGEKSFLGPLSIKKIPMIGDKTYYLLRNMGIELVSTLQDMPMELLQNVLGENGASIWKKANGIDNTPIEPYTEQKSMSQEETFETDTIDTGKLKNILIAMAEKLCFRLRTQNKLTGCVTVKIRYSNFDTHNMQCRIPYTSSDHTIIARVKELFEKLYNRRILIRLVGVKFSHLVGGGHQVNMFDDNVQVLNLYHAMDELRLRYGEDKIQRAAALHFSLRGFNPFNGINSSPAAVQQGHEDESTVVQSLKSINTLFNLDKNNSARNTVAANALEYLLVISPPLPVQKEVMEIKNRFYTQLKHIQAIRSKPHITLANFVMRDVDEEALLYRIEEVMRFHFSFHILLKNFNHYKTHTICIDISSPEPIVNLVRSLHASLNLPSSRSYFAWKPRLILAKGLSEEKFYKAMAGLQQLDFSTSFLADSISLMKRDSRFSSYETVRTFQLGN
jgi:DNA polymerase-4